MGYENGVVMFEEIFVLNLSESRNVEMRLDFVFSLIVSIPSHLWVNAMTTPIDLFRFDFVECTVF